MKITNNGNLTHGMKDLSEKACRAYQALRSTLAHLDTKPKLLIKLFDALIKPIALYGCEVWGSFGHKIALNDTKMFSDKLPFEKLHLKFCKQTLQISRRSSNFAARAELGRRPLMYNILYAVIQYRLRLNRLGPDNLTYWALKSQKSLINNSNKSLTFNRFTDPLTTGVDTTLNHTGALTKRKLQTLYNDLFLKTSELLKNKDDTKLSIYAKVKNSPGYEQYLDNTPYRRMITKFRVSDHSLPIERGRYSKPKLTRSERLCTLCHRDVGDEVHALFVCPDPMLTKYRTNYMNKISRITSQINFLSNHDKTLYILSGADASLNSWVGSWLSNINSIFRNSGKGK